jgi:hypothetical protein
MGMFATPAAVAASAARSSVTGSPQMAPVTAPSARPVPREGRESAPVRRAVRTSGSVPASWQPVVPDGSTLGAGPITVAAAALVLAGWLAALQAVRVRPARGGARVPVGTPGSVRGRAPPAHSTA